MNRQIHVYRGIQTYEQIPTEVTGGIEDCITSAFDGNITKEDARQHMTGDQVLVATSEHDQTDVHGFSAAKIISPLEEFDDKEQSSSPGLYLAGAAIAGSHQGKGLYYVFNEARLKFGFDSGITTVFTRTQNPRVQEGVTKSLDKMIQEGTVSDYEISRLIKRGVYGEMLTAEKPVAKELAFDDINHEDGDAVIITWNVQL